MESFKRTTLRLLALACVGAPLAVADPALAQAFPSKPLHLVIATSPGTAMDMIARLVAFKMADSMGQAVVTENQAGANGQIGAERVARSAPDGHTFMINSAGNAVTATFLTRNLPFDAYKDFTPITAAADPMTCLAVHPSIPADTLQEFVEYLKRNPGKVNLGTSGVGGLFHLLGEMFKRDLGVDIIHVPYKGLAPAVTATATGEVQMLFSTVSNVMPHWKAGKMKVLAILNSTRYRGMPGVPAINEIYPSLSRPDAWFGFFGPAGLPAPLLNRLNAEIVRAIHLPDVREKIEAGGMTVIGNSPQEFAAMFKASFAIYGRLIQEAGIKPEE